MHYHYAVFCVIGVCVHWTGDVMFVSAVSHPSPAKTVVPTGCPLPLAVRYL